MDILLGNLSWMIFNTFLALIPVVFVLILRRKMNIFLKIFVYFLWFLFLPNTIYMVTDLQYFPKEFMSTDLPEQSLLRLQFIILTFIGIMTFLFALEPFEKLVRKYKLTLVTKNAAYIILNFIVSFAVILGKVQRTHSVYIFTDFPRVVRDINVTISSQSLLLTTLLFGILVNIIYFSLRNFSHIPEVKKKLRS